MGERTLNKNKERELPKFRDDAGTIRFGVTDPVPAREAIGDKPAVEAQPAKRYAEIQLQGGGAHWERFYEEDLPKAFWDALDAACAKTATVLEG
jgi:hypothetical protein